MSWFAKSSAQGVTPRSMSPVGGVRIEWNHETLRKVSADNFRGAGYARMIQLKGKHRPYACVYEADGNTVFTSSINQGKTWSAAVIVAARENGVSMAVPDILQLQDGSLLAMYNPRPRGNDTTQHFGIKTKKSNDGGQTWTDERTLYQAGSKFQDGCWEPSAVQLPNGEIQLFFANEGPFTKSNEQNISMVRSKDGGLTWSQAVAVSFRKGSRDGMPVPVLLNNSTEVAFAIEDNGFKNFKPYIVRNSIEKNWTATVDADSPDRNYALADKIPDSIYAGAPYLRRLKTGEAILSYQGTEGRINNMNHSEMKVVIGDSAARNFNRKSVPFNIMPDRSGLWNSLCVTNDGNVIALTSTNNYSVNRRSEVWMIEGIVMPELVVKKRTAESIKFPDKSKGQIFIGQKGPTNIQASLSYDERFLYIEAHGDKDSTGIAVYIDPQNECLTKPNKGVYKIVLNSEPDVIFFEGDNGIWGRPQILPLLKHKRLGGAGYNAALAIPWKLLGGKPHVGTRIGFNMSLTTPWGKNSYTENIAGNDPDKPYTWCTLKLQ